MRRGLILAFVGMLVLGFCTSIYQIAHIAGLDVLSPMGWVGVQEYRLIVVAVALMLIVVAPVFVLTSVIAWRYRASNAEATYTPDHDHDTLLEVVWWMIPGAIIAALAIITYTSSHELDPYRPLAPDTQTLDVQVVALDWKWLFIYPEQGIATVNELTVPVGTPVDFSLTADAPMNSFWIPQLGGQVYAMPGMVTHLHLIADRAGTYQGGSANFSGRGFAGMTFKTRAVSQAEFDQWIARVRQSPLTLTTNEYEHLAKPSEDTPPAYYTLGEPGVFDHSVMKFMAPTPYLPSSRNHTTH